jgi:hypothetical protein
MRILMSHIEKDRKAENPVEEDPRWIPLPDT